MQKEDSYRFPNHVFFFLLLEDWLKWWEFLCVPFGNHMMPKVVCGLDLNRREDVSYIFLRELKTIWLIKNRYRKLPPSKGPDETQGHRYKTHVLTELLQKARNLCSFCSKEIPLLLWQHTEYKMESGYYIIIFAELCVSALSLLCYSLQFLQFGVGI